MMMKSGEHLTAEGIQKIINIRATLNKGLTPALKEAFPNSVAVLRPSLPDLHNIALHPQWYRVLLQVMVLLKSILGVSNTYKVGGRVNIIFVLTQHISYVFLLKSLVNYFGYGQAYSYKSHTEFISQFFKDN